MLAEGLKAPEVELQNQDGSAWPLPRALESGAVALVFFKTSCPTCQLTLPFLQRIAEKSARVFAVSQDNAAVTAQFEERFRVSMPMLFDPPPYPVSRAFRLTHVPSIFLIEPQGSISMAVEGFSKPHLEELASRFGAEIFRAGEKVPVLQPG